MRFTIEAACGCNKGKIRSNNEDNFYFAGKCLELKNSGLRHVETTEFSLDNRVCMAVFDGMGGERFGEHASFAAATALRKTETSLVDYFIPERTYLERLVMQLNSAVVAEAQNMQTEKMGSTMVSLFFSGKYVYVCNIGDSRAFRLRDGEFLQLSEDHTFAHPMRETRKAPLSQYLGIDPNEILIEPFIAKGKLEKGDQYLICSDGLTDMLTNMEISDIMIQSEEAEGCAEKLIAAALRNGGKDNVTVIVCRIS